MKRFFLVAMLVLGAVWVVHHHKGRCVKPTAVPERGWSWPDTPLSPRSHGSPVHPKSPASLHFASTVGHVRVSADAGSGVTVVVDSSDDENSCSEETATPSTSDAADSTLVESDLKYNEDRALD